MISEKILAQARELRLLGNSYNQISLITNIAKSTLSIRLHNLKIPPATIELMRAQRIQSQESGLRIIKINRENNINNIVDKVKIQIAKLPKEKIYYQIIAALLYWGEGNKTGSVVSLINSDPKMIKTFLTCLRQGYDIDESKLRALVHTHSYHDQNSIKQYWSKVTNIPLSQFTKNFVKPNTGKVRHLDYMGACRVRYYDVNIAHSLTAIYNTLSNSYAS